MWGGAPLYTHSLHTPTLCIHPRFAYTHSNIQYTGCTPLYVHPHVDPLLGCAHAVAASDIHTALTAALDAGHTVGAVLVVSPTYYGVMSDIAAIAEVVHARGVALIVDEAHGAHLGRHPDLPMVCGVVL